MREQLQKWLSGQKTELPQMSDANISEVRLRDVIKPIPIEQVLSSATVVSEVFLRGSSNKVYILSLDDFNQGIFKPKEGEIQVRKEIKSGTHYKRERAAYLVDRFLGLGLVPPTIIREHDGKNGSLQERMNFKVAGYATLKSDRVMIKDEMIKMWLFDYIIWNSDRHDGNWLMGNNGVYAIDNGCSFVPESFLRVYHNYFGETIPQEFRQKILDFQDWDSGKDTLHAVLSELLSEKEVDACLARIDVLGNYLKKHNAILKEDFDKIVENMRHFVTGVGNSWTSNNMEIEEYHFEE